MIDLGQFLQERLARPRRAGSWDCYTFPADWCMANATGDPMAAYRGEYASEAEAEDIMARAGGLVGIFGAGLEGAGLVRVAEARLGDIGVVDLLGQEAGAIYPVAVGRSSPSAAWVSCRSSPRRYLTFGGFPTVGKTLGSILAIGAPIAVNAIPGVGQFLSAAIGSTLATAVISSVTLYGLQAGVSLVSGSSTPKPDTTETAIKTSRPPRVSAYGESRLYGAYVLYETASNGTAVDVYAVHEGKLDAITGRYLGDETVTVAGWTVNAGPDGRYKGGAVDFYTTDGSIPGAGFPAIRPSSPSGRGAATAWWRWRLPQRA